MKSIPAAPPLLLLDRLATLRASSRRFETQLYQLCSSGDQPRLRQVLVHLIRVNNAFVRIEQALATEGVAVPMPPPADADEGLLPSLDLPSNPSRLRLLATLRRVAHTLENECESCAGAARAAGSSTLADACMGWAREWIGFEPVLNDALSTEKPRPNVRTHLGLPRSGSHRIFA